MKSIILLILFFLLYSQSSAFSDIQDSAFSAEIQTLKSREVVEGYGDGTYRPGQSINRVEFLKILLESHDHVLDIHNRFTGHNLPDYYSDTPFGSWYAVYVVAASELGIVEGYPDGTFRPERSINYAEASKVIVETLDLPVPQYFVQPSQWYVPYVDAIRGVSAEPRDDIFPSDFITRGEMAYMMVQAQQAVIDPPEEISPLRVFDTPHPGDEITGGYISNYHQWQGALYNPSLANLVPETYEIREMKQDLLEAINDARDDNGSDALEVDDRLESVTQNFVEHLVINGVYSHSDMLGQDPFERAQKSGYDDFVAESMVWRISDPIRAIEWWEDSELHWNNLMDPSYENVGIGITKEPTGGYIVVLLQGK